MLRRYIDFVTAPEEVNITPGSIKTSTQAEVREGRIKSALARLGARWVLAPTREKQLRQLHAEAWDLA
jgi:hypothetical protein